MCFNHFRPVFPQHTQPILGHAYGIFAAGYFFRPLGGVVILVIWSGAKNYFRFLFCWAYPVYRDIAYLWKYWVFGLLLLMRVVQGIAIGGEIHGPLYLNTSLKEKLVWQMHRWAVFRNFTRCAHVSMENFSEGQIHDWAWRIPFIVFLVWLHFI